MTAGRRDPEARQDLVLRAAEYLIGRACRRLPGSVRDERYREWTAELPAIRHDPDVRSGLVRSARALSYAIGTARSARIARRSAGDSAGRAGRVRPSAAGGPGDVPPRGGGTAVRAMVGLGIWLAVVVAIVTGIRAFQPYGIWPLVLGLALWAAFVGFCLTHVARAAQVRYLPKWGWMLACLLSVPLGGIMYFSVGRDR